MASTIPVIVNILTACGVGQSGDQHHLDQTDRDQCEETCVGVSRVTQQESGLSPSPHITPTSPET